jgi:hypothetical protein
MDWVYAAIVFGSLAYVGAIVVDYLNYRTGITPRIRQVEEGALEASTEFAAEERAAEKIRTHANRLQLHVDELRRQKTALQGRLVSERERKQRLEITVFKKRLKGKEPLLSA